MDAAARNLVRSRADKRCEYCLLRQEYGHLAHHVEHIVAKQHGGSDDPTNLALACHRCNHCKGPNLTGFDRESGRIVPLFHPRRERWTEHLGISGTGYETPKRQRLSDWGLRSLSPKYPRVQLHAAFATRGAP